MAISPPPQALPKTYLPFYSGQLAVLNRKGPAGFLGFQFLDQEGRGLEATGQAGYFFFDAEVSNNIQIDAWSW